MRYCAACDDGYHCTYPATEPSPTKDICRVGGYCAPSSRFIPCPAGSFSNKTGGESQFACEACPAGHFCLQATSNLKPLTSNL